MIRRIIDAFRAPADDTTQQASDTGRAFSNDLLGYGGDKDVVGATSINPNRMLQTSILEGLYINSWSAAKVVDLIVDDVFSPGIVWADEEDESTARMMEEMGTLGIMHKVPAAVKSARLYGTALVILAPKSQDFMEPLDIDNIKEGDITHVLVAPKEQLEIWQVYGDPRLPNYGKAYSYRWSLTTDGKMPIEDPSKRGNQVSQLTIHASRCLRFDGIKPNTDAGWIFSNVAEDRRWGISLINRIYDDIIQDLIMNAGGTELVKRASVPVIKMNDFRQALAVGSGVGDMVTPEEYGANISSSINSAKVLFMDKEDEVDSLEVRSAGVKDLIDQQTNRLAMIAGVPITRFKGESATGLSATGDGDARDWRISVEGYRKEAIDDQWEMLMEAVARNAGLAEVPDWEWGMLGEANMEEQATIAKTLAETVKILVDTGVIELDEARDILRSSELIDLDESWEPPVPSAMEEPQDPPM